MSFACCEKGCGGVFCFDPAVEARLRRTHEFFTCPFGHEQHFLQKTAQEEEIEDLKKLLRQADRIRDRWSERYSEVIETFGRCPLECGWHSSAGVSNLWMSMLRHFERAHQAMAEGTPMAALYFEVRNAKVED